MLSLRALILYSNSIFIQSWSFITLPRNSPLLLKTRLWQWHLNSSHTSSSCFTHPPPQLQTILFITNRVRRLNHCLDHTSLLSEKYQRLKKKFFLWIKVCASYSRSYIPSPSGLTSIIRMPSREGFHRSGLCKRITWFVNTKLTIDVAVAEGSRVGAAMGF